MFTCCVGWTYISTCTINYSSCNGNHDDGQGQGQGQGEEIPASSRLSSLFLEASDALLPPLCSHGQQLGHLIERWPVSGQLEIDSAVTSEENVHIDVTKMELGLSRSTYSLLR